MIRVAIVDDNQEIVDLVYKIVVDKMGKNQEQLDNIKCFTKPVTLRYELEEKRQYDLYLLDVEMPGVNGIELAKYIRKVQENAYIVFLTSHPEFAIYSYDLSIQAYQYILKGKMKTTLPYVLEKIQNNLKNKTEQFLVIHNNIRYEKIDHQKIIRMYKEGKNTVIVTDNEIHKKRSTLEKVLKELEGSSFIQIERGSIVNIERIDKILRNEVHMDNGDILEISRANVKSVKQRINQYWGEHI